MQKIGTVKFVQIQREPLKLIQNPDTNYDDRIYQTTAITRVQQLRLTTQGGIGITTDGVSLLDVHNETHPQTRYRGDNKISFGFTQHYKRIQERFGDHMTVGDAGENIIIEADSDILNLDTNQRFFLKRDNNILVELSDVIPAPPCRPFSVYCAKEDLQGRDLKEALQFLDNGTRGYYADVQLEDDIVIQAGDELWMT
ncbi:MAG: hypothetical protein WBC91_07385 [Phototrophicaceae bacterium]